ncbi:MAG: phosphatidylserine decarboxylase [Geminicoccaceae bacterium]|nr:phosphatidylserine decarboxylase [Geminicoccaceae bacterium]MCS7268932.1 phosphatidylserine decarboxylase [Geminicoccaceae bacterium]MDW8124860.1 phosphatidylserine decarboxylase [Geminicoccaceae bacterium]MDW8340812.1 phosphatidylserine decarboxylase [Geminicoccaceae bacterium]
MIAAETRLPKLVPPVHREGWKFVAAFLAATLLLSWLSPFFLWPGLALTLWCAWFFRDPSRVTPDDPRLVVSPADGRVIAVGPRRPPPELGLGDEPLPCVGIFMNVFDVHVNRTPVPGRVLARVYRPGKFLNASFDKASDENERLGWLIETPRGERVGLVQIAGLVARRIVPFAEPGAVLGPGDRVGLIRFGSRCDVYLPSGTTPLVLPGQRAIAGETILAELGELRAVRRGRVT